MQQTEAQPSQVASCRSAMTSKVPEGRQVDNSFPEHSIGSSPSQPLAKPPQLHSKETRHLTGSDSSTLEQELDWCIGQLELGLLRRGASKPQKQENERHMKLLRSSKTPLPRKRQVMRSLFGDYRTKMKSQPLPATQQTAVNITAVGRKTYETTGRFYKGSVSHTQPAEDSSVAITAVLPTTEFCFNFDIES